MPDLVVVRHRPLPALDHGIVHHGHGRERAPEQAERAAVAEMGVAGEEYGHAEISALLQPAPAPSSRSLSCGRSSNPARLAMSRQGSALRDRRRKMLAMV